VPYGGKGKIRALPKKGDGKFMKTNREIWRRGWDSPSLCWELLGFASYCNSNLLANTGVN
jgi:hypothetical protein